MSTRSFLFEIRSIVYKVYCILDVITFLILITDLKLKFEAGTVPESIHRGLTFLICYYRSWYLA